MQADPPPADAGILYECCFVSRLFCLACVTLFSSLLSSAFNFIIFLFVEIFSKLLTVNIAR